MMSLTRMSVTFYPCDAPTRTFDGGRRCVRSAEASRADRDQHDRHREGQQAAAEREATVAGMPVWNACGYRPVNRMATYARSVTTTNATHRTASTMECGMSSSHFTSHSHRLGASRRAVTRTGKRVTTT